MAAWPAAVAAAFWPPEVCDRPWSPCAVPVGLGELAGLSAPLLTNPATPSLASGSAYWCALTEKFGSESPPIVCSTPCGTR